jgi:hypothetical protein
LATFIVSILTSRRGAKPTETVPASRSYFIDSQSKLIQNNVSTDAGAKLVTSGEG